MIKVEVTEEFTYKEFDKIKDTLVRHSKEKEGWLYKGDTFECDEPTLAYLTGANKFNKTVVKVIEVIPEAVAEEKEAIDDHLVSYKLSNDAEVGLKVTKRDPEPKKTKKKRNK